MPARSVALMARPVERRAYADTNVFLAALAGPAHPFHEQAAGLMAAADAGRLRLIVPSIVIAEVIWAARPALGWTPARTAAQLAATLASPGVIVAEPLVARRALELLESHPRLDFADAWLAAAALETGPPLVASFDRDLDAVDGLERVEAA
jgi:predicted nucleic acid-binding protein